PKLTTLLKKALGTPSHLTEPRLIDLLRHMPTGVIDRRAQPDIESAVPGTIVTVRVRILRHNAPPRGSRAPYRIQCEDDTGTLSLIFFRGDRRFLEGQAPVGEERLVSGRVEAYNDRMQISHPDYIVPVDKADALPLLEPVYPLTAGLQGRNVIKATRQALAKVEDQPEWIEPSLVAREEWPTFRDAWTAIHRPDAPEDISVVGKPWQRLAYDELLAGQVALAMVRNHAKAARGRQTAGDGSVRARVRATMPFALTNSQEQALTEIWADMAAPSRMLRLLQGDVGSGKTAVALMAMAAAIEVGGQAALMAPTEVLARQHAETIDPLAVASGLRIGLLTGREKGKARREVLARLAEGEIDVLIGTHALFQPDVE
ncbi:MAG: DEAD/DEAH box helicase, partial [Pseudomonadota bacterium]